VTFLPEDHLDAYTWLVVLIAHAGLGLALVAVLAAVLDATEWITDAGRTAWVAVTMCYAALWEGLWQRIGAGWADAAVDSAAVALGGAVGVLAWSRHGVGLAAALLTLAGLAWAGVRGRK